ncbi:RagB/SusD family nutrient uptake outer membrane protein [Maribellus sediminis]|uniref:RagB/SusD family nutrient uptake outer membrane protein n=1 Tax=Maribellus sediminis TaxID=2696285 RepID=UPI00143173EB|nr:RagB/SusD family nutrient uptake outer membrane protein [Maribellus sediminis]
MKKIFIILPLFVLLFGCNDLLDIAPTNIISEDAVKNDPVLVDAFLNKIYVNTRFQSGSTYAPDQALLHVMSGEANVFAGWQVPFAAAMKIIDENGAHSQAEYWPYGNIRSCNEIIDMLKEATFDPELIEQKTAEARWLRAFMYFDLVKRYGGVPLITVAQSIDQPIEELYVERNSEKEIYDFIASEMDDLANILPESYSTDEFGRPTKWAALALKSRAMLYAGSIAKYGTVQLNGLLGIPSGEANSYYQKSYDAAMAIINGGMHPLYKENPDPQANYGEIFIKDGNSEVIFAEVYDLGLLKTHSWNFVCMPDGFQTGWGSNNWMYLESWERYEYNDGSSAMWDNSLLDGKHKFSLDSIIRNKDPRFLASAFYPETPWQDATVYVHTSTKGTIPAGSDWPNAAPNRNKIKTGMMIKKRVNEAIKLPIGGEDETDWIVFRTAEMYLNAAEAKFEMGEVDAARNLVNIIRDRAGMPDKQTLSLDELRNERYVELYIEEHHYWDIRRWRIAVDELNGKGFHGVVWDYYIDEDKYTLKIKDGDFGQIRTFAERNYYFPIGLDRIADNPNLVENPGY